MSEPTFNGQATIKVRFRNKAEYDKFRIYILKTKWETDIPPLWEDIVINFHNAEDIDLINKHIIQLLQLGFEVYTCRYKLEEQLAEEEHPREEDPEDIFDGFDPKEFDIDSFMKDLWTKLRGKKHD